MKLNPGGEGAGKAARRNPAQGLVGGSSRYIETLNKLGPGEGMETLFPGLECQGQEARRMEELKNGGCLHHMIHVVELVEVDRGNYFLYNTVL